MQDDGLSLLYRSTRRTEAVDVGVNYFGGQFLGATAKDSCPKSP